MASFLSSFFTLVVVLVIVSVVVALFSVAQLRIHRERRAQNRKQEVAEQVKKQLADLRNTPPAQRKSVVQDDYDFEHTGHEAGQRAKGSIGWPASYAQGTVGQDAHKNRATEAEPWATFHRGSVLDRQGEYDRAVAAYQQAIAAKHAEWTPKAMFNLGMLLEERGEYNLAEAAYQRAIASEHPDAASKARLNLGVLLEQRGAYDLAEKAYQEAINSGHPEVAPEGRRNLRGLAMRFPKRIRRG